MTDPNGTLPPIERRLHRVLLTGLIRSGQIPSQADLAATVGIETASLIDHLETLAAADYLALDASGQPSCLYPLSPTPTPHVVIIDGKRRYAMCSIDALGVAAMVDRPVTVESACSECGTPIRLRVAPGVVTDAEPPETVVVARRSGDEPACETCCPFTLFACDPACGQTLATRLPESSVVPLAEALRHAESIFANHLAETLPANRPRSQLTTSRLQT